LQAKVTVGEPGDQWERQADEVSERVMRQPSQAGPPGPPGPPDAAGGGRSAAGAAAPSRIGSPSGWAPLSDPVRRRIEPHLGADLSDVRVHNGGAAHRATAQLGADAFTHRNDVFLGRGQSLDDTRLLAHEAAHVVQQRAGGPAADVQRRIVMRSITPKLWHAWPLGNITVGTEEQLRPLTDAEVEVYVGRIGANNHEFDDLITGTGLEFGFVGGATYRRDLIVSIIRNLQQVRTELYFDTDPELVTEVRKRAMISLVMRATQGSLRGTRPTGYPGSCSADPGPRVSAAAHDYWIVHPASSTERNYWFELSDQGRDHATEAFRSLLFNHQSDPCLRTLMHCDYMVSAQQFYVLAGVMGSADFDRAVHDGGIKIELRWNSYQDIMTGSPTGPAAGKSLQEVELDSEADFVIGDHVVFFNHDAFDDLNQVHHNVRGTFSNWRLENAIISDLDSSGGLRFQGHGYFSPLHRTAFVAAMVEKMNELVDTARAAIASGNTPALGFGYDDGSRFEVVRGGGGAWAIHYHEGLGRDAALPVAVMPLRRLNATDYPRPFVQPGDSRIRVRRPIESRREGLDAAAAPAPPVPAPSPPAPVPSPPAPVPSPTAPLPAPTAPVPVPAPPSGPAVRGGQQEPATQAPASVPQTPPGPGAPACAGPVLLGSRTPQYGRGTDFSSYDFPSLSLTESLLVAPFRLMPNGMLEFGMNNTLGLLAGADGTAMVAHFRGGTGATWTHGVGSRLNREATPSPSVNSAVAAAQTQLAAQARVMRKLGAVRCDAFSLNPVPAIHFGFGDSVALKAIIGGTQGLEVYLVGLRVADPQAGTYDLDLQYVAFDDFGVDADDLYFPALIKFWILQHERPGNRPFINRLLINRTITV
jgi:hypothetical protein